MSNSSLQLFAQDGIEIVIDTNTGESFASISATARMCSKDESTIRRFTSSANFDLKKAEIPTTSGLRSSALLTEDQILETVIKYNPTLLLQFAKLGVRSVLHKMAGYEVKSTATEKPKTQLELHLELTQIALDLERRQAELSQKMTEVDDRVSVIEKRAEEATKKLKALPEATVEVAPRTVRVNLNTKVREYCFNNGIDHREAWNNLYREFRDRYHIDLKQRSVNGACKPLDIAEALEMMDELYALAGELFSE